MSDWIDKAATEIENAIRQHGAEYDVTFAAIIRKHVPQLDPEPMGYAVFCAPNACCSVRGVRVRGVSLEYVLVNERYNALIQPLTLARQGADGRGGLRAMLTQHDDRRRAEA